MGKKNKPSHQPPPEKPTPPNIIGHPTRKRMGEAVEAAFLARASGFNFDVARPWGECNRYDFLVGTGHGFWRVQVKSTQRYADSRYRVKATGWKSAYTAEQIDFIAAHIVPENLWYIVPVQSFASCKGLHFYPHAGRKAKYEKYREAWCLLACQPKARGWKDIPVLCRCRDLPVRSAVCPCR